MGDWTGTVPAFAAGAKLRGVDMQTLADIDTALATAWTTWTPTYTNLTITSATIIAKYRRVGKIVDYRWKFTLGASSAVGTSPKFTLPVSPSADYSTTSFDPTGSVGRLSDVGTAYRVAAPILIAANTIEIQHWNATPAQTTTTATVPFTFGTGDVLEVWGTYYTD